MDVHTQSRPGMVGGGSRRRIKDEEDPRREPNAELRIGAHCHERENMAQITRSILLPLCRSQKTTLIIFVGPIVYQDPRGDQMRFPI